jgi:orotidine-5'-phosphate decarboxylase
MENFADRLANAVRRTGNPVCVGLDPRWEALPASIREGRCSELSSKADAYVTFCQEVCDVVAPLVPIVKLQAAFFEELGPAGMAAMARVTKDARDRKLLLLIDGKRNDIGSTAEAYARGYLGPQSAWGADALTVNPYLGDDSLAPFFDVARDTGAGMFVLVKTSNPGGRKLQDLLCDGRTVFERMAQHVESLAMQSLGVNGYGIVGAVVGATYPAQLAEIRNTLPHAWFLVPGFGSQGGTAQDVAAAFDSAGLGAVINNSRGIIFAHSRREYAERFGPSRWQDAVDAATREMIAQLREVAPIVS